MPESYGGASTTPLRIAPTGAPGVGNDGTTPGRGVRLFGLGNTGSFVGAAIVGTACVGVAIVATVGAIGSAVAGSVFVDESAAPQALRDAASRVKKKNRRIGGLLTDTI